MTKIRVQWNRTVTPIGETQPVVRGMSREFSTAKAAAEFAADLVFMLAGPEHANASADKYFTVKRDEPAKGWRDSMRQDEVEVRYV